MDKIQQIDFKILKYIYLHRYHDADNFLIYLSNHTTFVTIAVFLLIVLYNRYKKIFTWYQIILGIVSILLAALSTNIIKILAERLRPHDVYNLFYVPVDAGGYSFPSGHTTEVFALALVIHYLFKNKFLTILFYLWAIIIAYTRMAFAAHFPTDILGGIFVGSLAVYFIFYKQEEINHLFNKYQ